VTRVKYIILFLFGCILINTIKAQPAFPDNREVYRDNVVPRIDILIHPDSLAYIYENVESTHEFPVTFIFNNGVLKDTLSPIGFRLRGNTSRYAKKKAFKLSFNTFQQGQRYMGLEKMNLNSEHNDPSIIRSKLCWNLLRKMEIPAPYANHVEVYINGNYYGLYINVENVDEAFVKLRFGNNDGNLYKCLWPADLTWRGDNPDNYKFVADGRRAYDLSINKEEDDYTDLRDFIEILHTTPDSGFKCAIEEVFNVYDYLKIMAFEMLSAQWDGYIYNKNNYYLYHNTTSGKFEFIPYDLDNTFGIDWFNIDWGTRNIYAWSSGESRPLYDRIMANDEFRDQFSFYMSQILEEYWNPDVFFPEIDEIRDMIAPFVVNDPYYPQDYGYTYQDFLISYDQPLGDHVKYGIKQYIQTRYNSASSMLVLNNIYPVIKYIRSNQPGVNQNILFRAYAEDNEGAPLVYAMYTVDEGSMHMLQLFDDGLHFDGGAGDKIFGNYMDGFTEPAHVRFQINAVDQTSLENELPCNPVLIDIEAYQEPLIFINELMAGNDSTIADEYGEYDDWIELYNAGTDAVWLGDKYLSNDLENPVHWQMPDFFLDPGAFKLFWADNTPDQGEDHTNFKLNKEGDDIFIFDAATLGYPLVDQVTFGLQVSDVSYGREYDGGLQWRSFDQPTPGYSNVSYGINDLSGDQSVLKVYPNPCYTGEINFNKNFSIRLFDLYGRLILESKNTTWLDVKSLKPGIYLLMTDKGQYAKIIVPVSNF
jgi:hypothetical protein